MKYFFVALVLLPLSLIAKPNHKNWDALLKKYVSASGIVNYKGFMADKAKLDIYLNELKKEYPTNSWTREEKMAFWINAYNAFTIKGIIDNYPVTSITEIKPKGAESIWKLNWIEIGSKKMSLDHIENGILRPEFKDGRIHFAINCASVSCPPLRNEAFIAEKLEAQLDEQTRNFFADSQRNKITSLNAQLSQIFNWFADDFKSNGSIVPFVNKYSSTKITSNTKISYLEYNWNLNE